jgi:hypothetical protein
LHEIISLMDKNSYYPPLKILILETTDEDDDMVEMGSPVASVRR